MFRLRPRLASFFAALCFLLAAASSSAQNTIHVPADYPSIQAGIDAAHNGDTVLVSPGTYTENIDFKGKSITLSSGAKNYSDAGSVILQGDGRNPVVIIQGSTSVISTLNGLTIQGGGNDDTSLNCGGITDVGASLTISNSIVTANGRCGVGAISGANLVVARSAIRTNNGQGLLLYSVGDVVLSSNLIEGNVLPDIMQSSDSNGAGITILSDNPPHLAANSLLLDHNIIRNNIANDHPAFEMQIGSAIKNLTLVNNAFYGNVGRYISGTQIYLSGPLATSSQPVRTSLTEVNNTIVGGGQLLVLYFASSTIENNLFYNTNPLPGSFQNPFFAGLSCLETNLPLEIRNNDIYNVGKQIDGGCSPGTNDLAVEPELRDIAGGDVREQISSSLANAGDLTAPLIPPADLDGKNRTVCNTIDIGAYELHPHPPIALTASANPSAGGNNVTFTAQLTGNCNVPTGTLTFFDGATPIGTGTLNGSAMASVTTAFLVVGQHTITAYYPGDFNFDDSTSNAVTETVTGFATATSLTVVPNPARAFQPISLNATVTAPYGIPSGSVTFRANGTALGSAALNGNGVAALTVSSLGGGTYNVVAVFNATTQYASSTSPVVTLAVVAAPSAVTLTAQPNPAFQGQPVTFTAGVAGTAPGSPQATGTVTFYDGATALGSVPLSGGQAALTTGSLAVGSHAITAAYTGDGNFNAATSPAVTEVIVAASFTLSLSPGSITLPSGQSTQTTVLATATGPYTGTLTLGTGLLPQYAFVSFVPTTLSLAGGGSASAVLTLQTATPPVRAGTEGGWPRHGGRELALACLAGLPLLLVRRARRLPHLLAILLACVAVASLTACGSVRYAANSLAPGTYVLPVTATDAATKITQTANLTLVVTR